MTREGLVLLALVLCSTIASSACRASAAEPAPPPANYELIAAPPGARGARAAGTDAAPPAPSEGEPAEPGGDDHGGPDHGGQGEAAEPELEEDGGSEAGSLVPEAGPGVAL